MRHEKRPTEAIGYVYLRGSIDHAIQMLLISIIDIEAILVGEDRVAYVTLS